MDQQYLKVTTAEALKIAVTAPPGTIFKTRLRVNLTGANGKPVEKTGVADLTISRETFHDAVEKLLDPEAEDGALIPLTVQKFESGECVYWIG